MVYMHTNISSTQRAPSNNERLRALVEKSGLTQVAALAAFNAKLGPAKYSIETWKSFLSDSKSKRFRPLKDELLEHAESVFSRQTEVV